jgi:hypothetical protein
MEQESILGLTEPWDKNHRVTCLFHFTVILFFLACLFTYNIALSLTLILWEQLSEEFMSSLALHSNLVLILLIHFRPSLFLLSCFYRITYSPPPPLGALRGPSNRSSYSIERLRPSPCVSGAPLSTSSLTLLTVFTIELLTEMLWASFFLVHGVGHTTIAVDVISQDVGPLSTILHG